MEYKHIALEIKADDARTIEGFASVFGNVDGGNDIVMPGAFTKSIQGRSPVMLWQHKADQPIGVWDEVRETPEGLYVKGRILETQLGNDAYTLAKAGALKGMSIGYGVKDFAIDRKTGARQLKGLDLFEVSLVTFPMNERATISSVKAAPATIREFEEFLREAGYDRDDATTIAMRGFKALDPEREARGRELETLTALFNQFTA